MSTRIAIAAPAMVLFVFATSVLGQAGEGAFVLVDSGQDLGDGRTFAVTLGDLDGDEDQDLFITQYIDANKVWINDGSGLFTASGQALGGTSGHGVDLGDLDGDGDLDAFVVFNSSLDRVYLNDGSGSFADNGQGLGVADEYGLNVRLGDIDGDNDLDALVWQYQHSNRVWVNDGNGYFSDLGQRIGGVDSGGMAPGDLDGDGDLDVFLTNGSAPNRVLLNNGAGIFVDSGQGVGTGEGRGHAALADLDGDDDLDVFVTNSLHGSEVFLNDGAGLYHDSGQLLGQRGQKVCLVDLDGDDDLDGVVTHIEDGMTIWLNNGSGVFSDSEATFDGPGAISVCAGDVDGDSRSDLIVGKLEGYGGNRLYFNTAGVPIQASGYLWLSGYDWSGNPTPIYRYSFSAGSVDLVVETGMQDEMVNNLATDPGSLYIGAGHGMEFWKANVLTGDIYEQGEYAPATSGLLMDGAFRASNGHLYRADAFGRLFETDTEGHIVTVHDVSGGAGMTGLEFVGDQLYGTCDAGFGSIDSGPAWTFNATPLSGLGSGPGWFYGGLAYDADAGILFLAVYRNDAAELYSVQPGLGTATLVCDLPAGAGFPLGAWPQAMGWVSDGTVGVEPESWGGLRSRFR